MMPIARGKFVELTRINLKSATYFIFCRFPDGIPGVREETPFTSVEVFRLPPMPDKYQPQTPIMVAHVASKSVPATDLSRLPPNLYMYDFFYTISGDRTNNYGFEYELIYTDPPAKPMQ